MGGGALDIPVANSLKPLFPSEPAATPPEQEDAGVEVEPPVTPYETNDPLQTLTALHRMFFPPPPEPPGADDDDPAASPASKKKGGERGADHG